MLPITMGEPTMISSASETVSTVDDEFPSAAIEDAETRASQPVVAVSEVDGHAVVGCGQFGVREPAGHGGGHVSEHDPLRVDLAEVGAQRLVVEVVADGPVEGICLDGE